MASGFFLGLIGIDDESIALATVFDSTGRGLWLQHLITVLLPGQLGISLIPALVGCLLYALSIALLVSCWGPIHPRIALTSSALMGSFPYFASMMTFDAVQIVNPLGFVLIMLSLHPIFNRTSSTRIALASVLFALAFACYQGVATTFAAGWVSIVGMRYLQARDASLFLAELRRHQLPRSLAVAAAGTSVYLLSVKLSQLVIPHASWSGDYNVKPSFLFAQWDRVGQVYANIVNLYVGNYADLPRTPAMLMLLGIAMLVPLIVRSPGLRWQQRALVAPAFLFSVLVIPFWLLFVQSIQLSPRSTVGMGILYGYIYAALSIKAGLWFGRVLNVVAAIIIFQFILTGNQMYYTQFLAGQADQMTISRIAARLDAVAAEHRLKSPRRLTLIGRYAPAGRMYARYDTIGSSALDWDSGSIFRQKALMMMHGVDGYEIITDSALRRDVAAFIQAHHMAAWPDPDSVFVYQDHLLVVHLGAG